MNQSEEFCRRFSLAEIKTATNNFDHALIAGKGGFGMVYKGIIDGGTNHVAIKRLNRESKQGAREFWAEIKTLSKLRHTNLVTLIGYCNDSEEMILVYEYVGNGTLADHLYEIRRKRENIQAYHLTWEERLKICISAARGLAYLHEETEQNVVHRDVKTTNILLDENWVAKISDLGLSKIWPLRGTQSHVSTDVKGTFGYFDPNYFLTRRLTKKSDVYAFGVVLLEVLCARPPVDTRVEEQQCSLTLWAQHCMKRGTLEQIIDPSLRGKLSPCCLMKFAEVANKCLHSHPKGRPTMVQVADSLELVLASRNQLAPLKEMMSRGFTRAAKLVPGRYDICRAKVNKSIFKSKRSVEFPSDLFQKDVIQFHHRFSVAEIRAATKEFHESMIIGESFLGKVYKGTTQKGNITVAIKRFNEGDMVKQNLDLFRSEIQLHPKLRHLHIVPLIGYCNDVHELILVYQFMAKGPLYYHLYETNGDHLPWGKRLDIAISAARGLQYLHGGTQETIIHQNLKSTQILLDENWVAKIAGLEFSVMQPNSSESTSLRTIVPGSAGYMAPEYISNADLTTKSDVFSFGVILLELFCGRKPMVLSNDIDHVNVVRWFRTNFEMGTVEQIIDHHLINQVAPSCFEEYVKIAADCVRDEAVERPSMDDVLGRLWYALQLQKSWLNHEHFCAKLSEEVLGSHVQVSKSRLASMNTTRSPSPDLFSGNKEDSDFCSCNLAR